MTAKMMLLKTMMSMIKILMMLMLLIKTMMMLMILIVVKMQLVSVMSYKPVFCRNHAETPASRTF